MVVTAPSQQHECKYPHEVNAEATDTIPLQVFKWRLIEPIVKDKDKYHINVIE